MEEMATIISEETAQEQLDFLLDYYDIDIEDTEGDGSLPIALKASCRKLKRAIKKGRIEIGEENNSLVVYQNLVKPIESKNGNAFERIRYREVDGRSKTNMKGHQDTDYHGRMYAFLGGLSGESSTFIEKLKGVDLSIAECLGSIFLQV